MVSYVTWRTQHEYAIGRLSDNGIWHHPPHVAWENGASAARGRTRRRARGGEARGVGDAGRRRRLPHPGLHPPWKHRGCRSSSRVPCRLRRRSCPGPPARQAGVGPGRWRPAARVRSHCRFRDTCAEHVRGFGMTRVHGSAKRRCDRAPRTGSARAAGAARPRAASAWGSIAPSVQKQRYRIC